MTANRTGAVISLLAAGAVVLSGCGTDDNSAAYGSDEAAWTPAPDCGGTESLKASGSSAQANAMTRFVNAYQRVCRGFTVNYTSSGSGAGVSEFTGGQTDFGGSDSPLNYDKGEYAKAKQRCGGADAWNLPTVFGPIAVTYNLEGVDGLVLDGPTLAKIFNGTVTTWDAPEIAVHNAGKPLPARPINVIFRSDESGTTDNFQKYLDVASDGAWGKGTGKSFAGGVGEGAKGNEGTSAAITNTTGSITYNEWSYATKQGLSVARIVTSAGPEPVTLNLESAGKAIDSVKVKGEGNDLVLDTSSFYVPTEAGSYPIMLATYQLVCSKYPESDVAPALRKFLTVALDAGQGGLEEAGYIPVPEKFKQRLTTAVDAIS